MLGWRNEILLRLHGRMKCVTLCLNNRGAAVVDVEPFVSFNMKIVCLLGRPKLSQCEYSASALGRDVQFRSRSFCCFLKHKFPTFYPQTWAFSQDITGLI